MIVCTNIVLNFDQQLHSGRAGGSDKESWWRFETKAAVNQVFSRRPWPGIGRKRGRRVLALALIEKVEGIEYGNWMVGMGIGWVEMGVIFHQEVYGVHGICQKANKEWFCVGSKYVKLLLQKMNIYQLKRS